MGESDTSNVNTEMGEEFVVSAEDDLWSWIRCWILGSDERMAKKYSEIERENDLRIMAFKFFALWNGLIYFPRFIVKWDSGAEDLYKMAVQYPLLMSFQSCKYESQNDSDLDVFVDKFRETFIHIVRACAEYVVESKTECTLSRMRDFVESFYFNWLLDKAYDYSVCTIITEIVYKISAEENITVCLEKLRSIIHQMLR
jgi:hypothetical protein